MMFDQEEQDFGIPYTLFKDIKNGNKIYSINYKNIEITEHEVSSVLVEDRSDHYNKNRFWVEFKITNNTMNDDKVKVYDGNTFIHEQWDGKDKFYYTTDKRIAEMICSIMRSRNIYQWDTFTSLFEGIYAKEPIIIR